MLVHVNPSSGFPIYLQIEGQLKQAMAAGALRENDPLPSVRRLAADLRINPNTVVRAYQDLERDGLIRTVPGGGCFVSGNGVGLLKSEKIKRLRPLATQVAVEGRQLRLPAEEILDLVKEELEKLQ